MKGGKVFIPWGGKLTAVLAGQAVALGLARRALRSKFSLPLRTGLLELLRICFAIDTVIIKSEIVIKNSNKQNLKGG